MRRDLIEAGMVADMKIVVVSQNKGTAGHFRSLFEGSQAADRPRFLFAGLEQLESIAQEEGPDVLVVEGTRHDERELLEIEPVVTSRPEMAVVLLSPNQSSTYLRLGMRIGLREILPMPLSSETLLETFGSFQQRAATAARRRGGRTLCFVGCKGGSGATFLSANIGYAAAMRGRRVALIDLNTQFGDAVLHVSDRVPAFTLADVARDMHRLDAAFLASSMLHVLPNFHVLPAPDEPDQTLQLHAEHVDAVLSMAAASYDLVIVDAGRSLNELTVRAMDHADTVLAVLQQSLPFLRDAQRLLRSLGGLGYGRDKVKLVINRFDKDGLAGSEEIARSLKHEVLHIVPNSFGSVSDSINQGVPIVKLAARDAVARSIEQMAGALAPAARTSHGTKPGGWLRKFLPAH